MWLSLRCILHDCLEYVFVYTEVFLCFTFPFHMHNVQSRISEEDAHRGIIIRARLFCIFACLKFKILVTPIRNSKVQWKLKNTIKMVRRKGCVKK